MRPQTVTVVTQPMRLESNRVYPPMEVRLDPANFAFTNAEILGGSLTYTGMVYGVGLRNVHLPFLRVVGSEEWLPRFNADAPAPDNTWQRNLWLLSGLHLFGGMNISIDRFEAEGFPRSGITRRGVTGLRIGSADFKRCGYTLQDEQQTVNGIANCGASVRNIVTRDNWWRRALDPTDQWRSKTLRNAADNLAGGGELVGNGFDYEIVNFVHRGDGAGAFKCSGSRYRIEDFHGCQGFLNGVVPANLTGYPGEEYRHLHEAKGIEVVGSTFSNESKSLRGSQLLTISYPFDEIPWFRKCVFVKGEQHSVVANINWATVGFDDCDFVGWANQGAAFLLGGASGGMPAASVSVNPNCRYWAS